MKINEDEQTIHPASRLLFFYRMRPGLSVLSRPISDVLVILAQNRLVFNHSNYAYRTASSRLLGPVGATLTQTDNCVRSYHRQDCSSYLKRERENAEILINMTWTCDCNLLVIDDDKHLEHVYCSDFFFFQSIMPFHCDGMIHCHPHNAISIS